MTVEVLNHRYKKIALGFAILLIFGVLHTWVIFPPLLKQKVLKPGTLMRDMYVTLPFPLIFKIFIFNVLNPNEVMKGAKPKLQEVGPFVFEEWLTKVNQVDDDETDTLEFDGISTLIYNQTLSSEITGDEIVTVLHPLITGMALTVNVDRVPMLPFLAKAINEIFHKPETAFWTGKALDILFNGIDVDCTSANFNSKATCSVFSSGEVKAVVPKRNEKDVFLFSILGAVNGTSAGRFKVYRGVKNIDDVGRVIEFNGKPNLDVWDGDECNRIQGTEASTFPPYLSIDPGVWTFAGRICRSMKLIYERPSQYQGVPTIRYHLDLGDIAADESEHCYCNDDKCPLKGTMNLFPCIGSPLIASMPHFYNGDLSLFEEVESGLEPDKDKHEIYIDFEIISGTPMSASSRLQLNYDLLPVKEIQVMAELPEMIFPLLWVDQSINLNKTFVNMLKYQLFLGLKYHVTVKWLSLIIGTVGFMAALFLIYRQRNTANLKETTAVKKVSAKSDVAKVADS